METKAVYGAIAAVQAELAKEGIGKDRENAQQNYKFRGIDDVYNALAPIVARHHLCILPRCIERTVTERQTQRGGVLFYATVHVEFDLVSAVDGSTHIVSTYGEAMDSGDKATNKAMSAAYKYMAMMTFAIPTEGDNDADLTTHDVAPRKDAPKAEPKPASNGTGKEPYPKAKFDSNFPAWAKKINEGKSTPEAVIAKLESISTLSEAQRNAIKKIGGPAHV